MIETQDNTVSDDLVEKIKKLLRLATSTNEHEASLALERCKKLATEYDIELSSIDVWDEKKKLDEIISKNELNLNSKRKSVCSKTVVWLILKHFNCRVIHSGSRYYGQKITFIGKKKDIEISTYVYGYLNNLFMDLWREYKERTNANTQIRESYVYGLYKGLNEKLTDAKQKTEVEKFTQIEQEKGTEEVNKIKGNYSLMIISDSKRLDEKVDEFFPRCRTVKTKLKPIRNFNALEDGRQKGKTINIVRGIGFNSGKTLT